VGKFKIIWRQIFTGCCVPKIIQIAQFSTELFPKQKGGRFLETQCIYMVSLAFKKSATSLTAETLNTHPFYSILSSASWKQTSKAQHCNIVTLFPVSHNM